MLAEGIQSFLDIFASTMILYSVRAAAAPPDRAHPWGHGKIENASAMVQMLLVLASIVGILAIAWVRWMHPVMPQVGIGIAALLISVLVNLLVSRRVRRVAKTTDSSSLLAEAVHLQSDLWACSGVLTGLVLTHLFNNPRLDPVCAILMTAFAFYSAGHLMRDSLRPLLDESLPAHEETRIKEVLKADARVIDFHKLRTRRAGSMRLVDVHVMLPDEISFRQAHDITEEIEVSIRQALPNVDVIVHPEPYEEEMRIQRARAGESDACFCSFAFSAAGVGAWPPLPRP